MCRRSKPANKPLAVTFYSWIPTPNTRHHHYLSGDWRITLWSATINKITSFVKKYRLSECRLGGMSSNWMSAPWNRLGDCRLTECRLSDRYPIEIPSTSHWITSLWIVVVPVSRMTWCTILQRDIRQLDVRLLAVASLPRQSETEWRVSNYSRIGAYRTYTSGKDFPCELCAQNSGDVSWIIKVITI